MIMMKKLLTIGAALSAIMVGAYNGDSKVEKVKPEVFVEQEHTNLPIQEYTNFLISEEMELEKDIANETGFKEESIKVNLMPISGGEYPEIACVILLSTENKLNKTTEQLIVKNIMTAVSDIKNTKLSEKHISILYEKGEILN